jgi:hypothetical protein
MFIQSEFSIIVSPLESQTSYPTLLIALRIPDVVRRLTLISGIGLLGRLNSTKCHAAI